MIIICPSPIPWEEAYQRLSQFARENHLDPPQRPLVLSLWHLTDDVEKRNRWQHHLQWASDNGCEELLSYLPESDFYTAQTLYVSPHLPSLFAEDNYKKKIRPTDQELDNYLKILKEDWKDIVGKKLSRIIIKPICFSGKKARCLRVLADGDTDPPWGDWGNFNGVGEVKRYQFTIFRAAICKAIAPHMVDHIKFFNSDGNRLDSRYTFSFNFKGISK
jgi:hypothetical protein